MCRRRTEEQSNGTEVANWNKLIDQNGYHGLREKGQLRLEGKEYIVTSDPRAGRPAASR